MKAKPLHGSKKRRVSSSSTSQPPVEAAAEPSVSPFLKRRRTASSAPSPAKSALSQPKMSRWQPPAVEFERKNVFCMTKAEAHEVYNLSNSGQDPRTILEDIFSEEDWMLVFCEVPKRGSKIKCKTVRREYWDRFYTLFTSVYQEPPGNYGMEVTRAFGKGFLYEQVKGKVDWAAFAESIVAHMEAGKLQSKRQRWTAFHSGSGLSTSRHKTMPAEVEACNTNRSASLHVPVRMDLGRLDDILGLLEVNHRKAVQELDETFVELEAKRASMHRNEGAMGLIESIKKQLDAARARVRELDLVEDKSQLQLQQTKVANLEISLETFSADFQDIDHATALGMAVLEYERKQSDVKIIAAQLQFVKDMHIRKSAVLLQVPPPKIPSNEFRSDWATFCGACGVPLFDDEVLQICMLPCRHPYHAYCFAHMAAEGDNCLVSGCSHAISRDFKSLLSIDSGNTSHGGVKIGKEFYFFCFCDSNGSSFLSDEDPVMVSY